MNALAPMIVLVTLILTTGGVILFRPLVKHLAAYLQTLTAQNVAPGPPAELARTRELLMALEQRLTRLEERQEFTESLLSDREAPHRLAAAARRPDHGANSGSA